MTGLRGLLRRARPVLSACLAVAVGGAAAGATVLALSSYRGATEPRMAGDPQGRPSAKLTPALPVAPDMAAAPSRIVPPDVLAVADGSIDKATLRDVARLAGVREMVSFAGGSVRLRGRRLDVFGVQPSTYRAWTPSPTATTNRLWTALARDELVTSVDARRERRLALGESYRVEGRGSLRIRLGAVASLGVPGVDALVGGRASKRLGLVPRIGILVNAPGTDMDELAEALRTVLGEETQVVSLRERDASGGPPTESPPRRQARSYLDLYKQAAARCPGLSWTVLAAIGQIESGHGRNAGPSSAGALGPMQFMPGTWAAYGVDGDGDGRAEIMNPYDAVPSAAGYLCANGAGGGGDTLASAIWHYNHAGWYVEDVLSLARSYARTYG